MIGAWLERVEISVGYFYHTVSEIVLVEIYQPAQWLVGQFQVGPYLLVVKGIEFFDLFQLYNDGVVYQQVDSKVVAYNVSLVYNLNGKLRFDFDIA